MFIPHDHHYDFAADTDYHHNHSDKQPIHCHFMDYATTDATIQKTFNQQIVLQPILLAVLDSFTFEKIVKKIAYFIPSESKPNLLIFLSPSPTRGSPTFS